MCVLCVGGRVGAGLSGEFVCLMGICFGWFNTHSVGVGVGSDSVVYGLLRTRACYYQSCLINQAYLLSGTRKGPGLVSQRHQW